MADGQAGGLGGILSGPLPILILHFGLIVLWIVFRKKIIINIIISCLLIFAGISNFVLTKAAFNAHHKVPHLYPMAIFIISLGVVESILGILGIVLGVVKKAQK